MTGPIQKTPICDLPSQIENTNSPQLVARSNNLFNSLTRELLSYYSKDWNDIKKVKDFLTWFDRNRGVLSTQFANDLMSIIRKSRIGQSIDDSTLKAIFSVWLGAKYTASIGSNLARSETTTFPSIIVDRGPLFDGSWSASHHAIRLHVPNFSTPEAAQELATPPNTFLLFLRGFNLGIHETTHGLRNILNREGELNEDATRYIIRTYGLPIKVNDLSTKFFSGLGSIRDFSRMFSEYERGNLQVRISFFMTEYLAYVFGPWLSKHRDKDLDVLQLETGSKFSESINLLDLLSELESRTPGTRNKFIQTCAENLCSALQIKDSDLKDQIKSLYMWIANYYLNPENKQFRDAIKALYTNLQSNVDSPDSPELIKFLQALVKELDTKFGKPDTTDIPNGYAYFDTHNIQPRRTS